MKKRTRYFGLNIKDGEPMKIEAYKAVDFEHAFSGLFNSKCVAIFDEKQARQLQQQLNKWLPEKPKRSKKKDKSE